MPNTPPRLVAGGTIMPCRFVKMSAAADDRGLQAEDNDPLIGVSYDSGRLPPLQDIVVVNPHAVVGDPIGLYGDGDQCLLELGDDVVRGNKLKADANGCGVPVAVAGNVLQQYGAIALESGAAGEKVRVFILLGSERPAIDP